MGKDVIVACDFPSAVDCREFLKKFSGVERKPYVKIGMELFYSCGPDIVREFKALGHGVFLDLKLCDIPNTVRRAMKSVSSLGADIVNVHAFGGIDMMRAAKEGIAEGGGSTKVIAVTVLTSIAPEKLGEELLIDRPLADAASAFALNAKTAGLDGVVCSVYEAGKIHGICGRDFLTVTPGIRFGGSDVGDQARVATPEFAKEQGSDYIVVGRPITKAADPVSAYTQCLAGFAG